MPENEIPSVNCTLSHTCALFCTDSAIIRHQASLDASLYLTVRTANAQTANCEWHRVSVWTLALPQVRWQRPRSAAKAFTCGGGIHMPMRRRAMKTLRPSLALIASFAFLVNSAAAMSWQCSIRIEEQSCCDASVEHWLCIGTADCCTLSAPAQPPQSQDNTGLRVRDAWPTFGMRLPLVGFVRAILNYARLSVDRICVSGPPLLALHCSWLN